MRKTHLASLFFGMCLITLPTTAATPPVSGSVTQQATKIDQILENKTGDVYDRLERLEAQQKTLKTLIESYPKESYLTFLQGFAFYQLVAVKAEMGQNAMDYWAYNSEVVEPIKNKALKWIKLSLQDKNLEKPLKARAYYYHAQLTSEYAEDEAKLDLKKACALHHAAACKEL